MTRWHTNYPDKNIYDDYYSDLFQLNALAYPQYQRSKGIGSTLQFLKPN